MSLKNDIVAYAKSLDFERVGVTSAAPFVDQEKFMYTWLEKGRAGEMHYLEKEPQRRARPRDLLPEAKTIIAVAMNYYQGDGVMARSPDPSRSPIQPSEGRISRYAWGQDYHKIIGKRLDSLVRYIESLAPEIQCRTFVDTGPILERPVAQRAGLGFIGKNTMLITRGLGSWVFLANIITSLNLPVDAPDDRSCGECRLCIDACPTAAITAPYELDPRRCIAYLTIELDSAIEPELRPKMGEWIFGCDICQDVCPHNTHIPTTKVQAFRPERSCGRAPLLADILDIGSEEDFAERFGGTPLTRAERHGLIRNACLAAANLQRRDLIPRLEKLSRLDPHPVVRETAAWTLQQLC